MATPALNSRVQSLVTEYGVFFQFWPQSEQTHGEGRSGTFELCGNLRSSREIVQTGDRIRVPRWRGTIRRTVETVYFGIPF